MKLPSLELGWRVLPRLTISLLFAAAAVTKLRDPSAFVMAVGQYRILNPIGAYAIGLLLPWLELAVAVALLFCTRLRIGAWLLATLLSLAFAAAQGSAWIRGLDITCGCFGGSETVSLTSTSLRVALVAFTLWGWHNECRLDGRPRI